MKPHKMSRSEAIKVLTLLDKSYPDIKSELSHETPFELLVGTILSAQATDRKVNEITGKLFMEYKIPETVNATKKNRPQLSHSPSTRLTGG